MNIFKNIFLLTGVFISSTLMLSKSNAQIIVSDAILEFKNTDRLISSIAVGNASSNKNLHLTSSVQEVLNPASDNLRHVVSEDVFTVPKTFTLNPRSQHTIRIASKTRPKNIERIFRITFNPTKITKNTNVNASSIDVFTTTAVMVILNPPEPIENLTWVRTENNIKFKNEGNTNIILRRDGFCAKNIPCTIKGQRLWTGDTWNLKLPESLREEDIFLEMRVLGEIKEVIIPYDE